MCETWQPNRNIGPVHLQTSNRLPGKSPRAPAGRPLCIRPDVVAEEQFPAADQWYHGSVWYREVVTDGEPRPARWEQLLWLGERRDEVDRSHPTEDETDICRRNLVRDGVDEEAYVRTLD